MPSCCVNGCNTWEETNHLGSLGKPWDMNHTWGFLTYLFKLVSLIRSMPVISAIEEVLRHAVVCDYMVVKPCFVVILYIPLHQGDTPTLHPNTTGLDGHVC